MQLTDLPEELFERIIAHMGTGPEDGEGVIDYRKEELGRCALVSRYWASRCQEKIFRRIEVRGAKDVRELLVMLERPGTAIAQYMRVLSLPRQGVPRRRGCISSRFCTPDFHSIE